MIPAGERNGNPLQYSCLENPRDWGAWWAAVCRVTQSRTQLKRLSSSSSMIPAQVVKSLATGDGFNSSPEVTGARLKAPTLSSQGW